MSGRLAGRRALITGAATGIGAAIGTRFTEEGASVVLTGRRTELGEKTVAAIRATGGDAYWLTADASTEPAVEALVAAAVKLLGGLDIVVNNAGVAPAGPLAELDYDTWQSTFASNVTSMFLVTKHAIPELRRSEHASIINLGSTFGMVGAAGSTVYAMTKAAAISLSKSLALELAGDGIRVNALCPGATDTDFLEGWAESTGNKEGTYQWLVDHHPIGRLSRPEEQAAAALFLASDDSSYVTGHTLMVDGGFTAQ